MTVLDRFLAGLPKAELHLHIEGTLEPEMLFRLARRNGIRVPYDSVGELRAAYDFGQLQDFLDLYYAGVAAVVREEDFFELAEAYLDRARQDGVRHAEVFFDPQAHTLRGVAFETLFEGLHTACAEAEQRHGISVRLILCFLRDRPVEEAELTLEQARPFFDRIAGVGLDSAERGNPPGPFARVFEKARAEGLRAVAHAGEEGPAAYIEESLDLLKAERIDHGVRALEDPALVRRLAEEAVPLTVCPLSNLRLCVVGSMAEHPLPRLMAEGLTVTINSDDPAYFGGYVNANYAAVAETFGLDRETLCDLAANSFRAAFLPEAAKEALVAEVERYRAHFCGTVTDPAP